MQTYLSLNLFLAVLWTILIRGGTLMDFFVGFVLGMLLLSFVEPSYGQRGGRVPLFVLNVLFMVIVSSIQVAYYIVNPGTKFRLGVVAVPLDVRAPFEIATLASAITLTPGTMSVDLGTDDAGDPVLFVHSLMLHDPDALRTKIKQGFERQILLISQGASGA